MPTYRILTFGCRVNQADSLALERDLLLRGLQPSAEDADVVVVNTCSVTATADQGARQAVRRVHRAKAGARVILTGCYATRCADEARQLPGVVALVPNGVKDSLAETVARAARGTPMRVGTRSGGSEPRVVRSGESDADVTPGHPDDAVTSAERCGDGDGPCGAAIQPGVAGRTVWTLRVQTGCEQSCAYCVIPSTRGRSRSRPIEEISREITSVAAAGYREVAITGVHLGSWGRDLVPRASLAELIAALVAHPGDVTFRISSLEPMDCTPEVRALFRSPRIMPHFHLPLQHASDCVLSAMRRPYSLSYYADLVAGLRASLPDASIGSDMLVGFPGESDHDHAANLDWLAGSPLTQLHVFPYSDRPGTDAAAMSPKTSGDIIRRRADEIRQVARALAAAFRARMLGTLRPGLTLEDGTLVVTDNYLKVRIPPGLPRNTRVRVRITSAGETLQGVVEG